MQLPSILQGESLTRLLQGAAAGAVATIVVGFSWGGWSLGSTADAMAKARSELAVVAALAPVCADKFRALPDAEAKTVALSKVELVEASGRIPQGACDPPWCIVPEFRPGRRVLHIVVCSEVSRAQLRQRSLSGTFYFDCLPCERERDHLAEQIRKGQVSIGCFQELIERVDANRTPMVNHGHGRPEHAGLPFS